MCLLLVLCSAQYAGKTENRVLGRITEAVTKPEPGRRAVELAAACLYDYDGSLQGSSAADNRSVQEYESGSHDEAYKDEDSSKACYDDSSGLTSTADNASGEEKAYRKDESSGNMPASDEQEESGLDPETLRLQRLEELTKQGYIGIDTADPDSVSVCFAGDILFDEHYAVMASMLQRAGGGIPSADTAFDDRLLEEMRSADIFMLNNEFPYSDRGAPLQGKKYTFRARPEYSTILHDIGADIVSLANNHVNDYGMDAMTDTFETLKNTCIPYVGAGYNIEEASSPVRYTDGNIKLAFIAATQIERMSDPDTVGAGEDSPGVFRCLYDMDRLTSRIKAAKDEGCFTIVYIHWGTESTEIIDDWQLRQCKQIAGAGADLIIGDHPHVLQRLDIIEGTPVIYSLGNYLFNSRTQDTCILNVRIDTLTGELCGMRIIPAVQSGCRTSAAEGSEYTRILTHLQEISPSVSIDTETGEVRF